MHVATAQLVPILQTAIAPMILISGVGLLLLTMSNRLGRTIDRARILAGDLAKAHDTSRAAIEGQLRILWTRARLIRTAIALASVSALAAALLIIVLFFAALWELEAAWLIGVLFLLCMACLIGSLIIFIHDINRALAALKLELNADITNSTGVLKPVPGGPKGDTNGSRK